MKDFLKKYGAYIVALAVFVSVAYVYCFPVLEGKVIYAGDTQNYLGASNEGREYHAKTGDVSWWTGSMFSGMPNYQVGGGYYRSDSWLRPVHKLVGGWGNETAWIIIFYFICFFVMLRAFGVDKWTSIAGALATGLSSYFLVIIAAGHVTKTMTIATTAVVLAGFYLIFRKKYALGAVLVMVFTAAGFSRHPQMFYYYCMLIGLLWIAELAIHIKEKRYKDLSLGTAAFILAVAIGVGTGSSNVFANAEYTRETMRGGTSNLSVPEGQAPSKGLDLEYATQWSYGIDETMSFLIPGFRGGASTASVGKDSQLYKTLLKKNTPAVQARTICENVPLYWGEQPFTAGNVYMGAIVCFLFVLGLLLVKGPYKWALLAATCFSVILSWGHNLMPVTEAFFKWFPLYSKFRAVSSILIIAEVTMPLLGFLALKEIFEGKVDAKELKRQLLISSGITGGICLVCAVLGPALSSGASAADGSWVGQVPQWLYLAIINERLALLRSDSIRSLLFIAAALAVLWLYVSGKLRKAWVVAALAVLVVADLWPVDKRYFNDGNFVTAKQSKAGFQKMPWELALSSDKDPNFRVLNLTTSTYNDSRTSTYFKSIGGYSAAKLRRYQELIDQHLSKMDMPVLNMLNTKYFIVQGENGQAEPRLNPDAMGNAWFVESVVEVPDADAESAALMEYDLGKVAVVEASEAGKVACKNPGAKGEVKLTSYSPKALSYEYSTDADGVVVFSEIYYPYGWKASIDGQAAEHFRANYLLRAMNVPAGEHRIDFVFDPDSVKKGETLALASIIMMYLSVAGAVAFAVVRRRKQQA